MAFTKRILQILILMLVVFALAGCASTPAEPTVTPTPVPPTPIPPTPTPTCEIICNVDTEQYGVEITCESGKAQLTLNDSTKFDGDIITATLKQSRTYENTGNTYQINGEIVVDKAKDEVSYFITVTGGVFGAVPQTCEN